MMAAIRDTHPYVDGIVSTFNLPKQPVDLYLRGLNGGLDYCGLTFGTRYRLRAPLTANSRGSAAKGEVLLFLGYYCFPYDSGLRLFFERKDETALVLEFAGLRTDIEGVSYMDNRNRGDFFASLRFDFSKRKRRLLAARAIIEHHKRDV